ncbi:MAG: glutaredoxin 3 [Coxiella sp. (in: Bacteria)]|nr:MAG: glutaredoxin 3 [Coxiella sp. (in: g-proteobacteria)]
MTEVVVYSRAACAYCDHAKQLLQTKGIAYEEIRVDLDPDKLSEMLEKSGGLRTFPQIIINGKGIGGFSELWALEQQGALDKLINT